MKAATLTWGLHTVETEAPAMWGARCILDRRAMFSSSYDAWCHSGRGRKPKRQGPTLDILWDRQSLEGDTTVDVAALKRKLNGPNDNGHGAIEAFRKWVEKEGREWPGGSRDTSGSVVLKGVRFHYLDRGGYLYVAAHVEPQAGEAHGTV